jgi:hypothetical protein
MLSLWLKRGEMLFGEHVNERNVHMSVEHVSAM